MGTNLVLVMTGRFAVHDEATLRTIRDAVPGIACKHRHQIKRMSLMPDHLHMALVGHFEQTPEEIALAYQNNIAFALGQKPIWQERVTTSEPLGSTQWPRFANVFASALADRLIHHFTRPRRLALARVFG